MSIYVLSLEDYEDYKPYYFDCDCSKEDFDRDVKDCLDKAADRIFFLKEEADKKHGGFVDDYNDFIDGYNLISHTVYFLEKLGYKSQMPQHEISIHGACPYRNCEDKPEIISKKTWEKIITHNEKSVKDFYKEQEKGE